jgi:hypothetical protein
MRLERLNCLSTQEPCLVRQGRAEQSPAGARAERLERLSETVERKLKAWEAVDNLDMGIHGVTDTKLPTQGEAGNGRLSVSDNRGDWGTGRFPEASKLAWESFDFPRELNGRSTEEPYRVHLQST